MKILLCIDGSLQSKKGIDKVKKLIDSLEYVDLIILHVREFQFLIADSYAAYSETIQRKLEKQKENLLDEAIQVFNEGKKMNARKMLKRGHPAETIVEVINGEKIDLVVMGSRGFGNLKRMILGSVSNAVIKKTTTNVVIIK